MDEEVITISTSSTSSSGCSSADLIETDGVNSKDLLGEEVNISGSSVQNNGSITTEPLRDSDAACDWEIYETWTILGEPVMRPIIIDPQQPPQAAEPEAPASPVAQKPSSQPKAIQEQPKAGNTVKPPVKQESHDSVSADLGDIIDDDVKCVVVSDPCTIQKEANILTVNNTLVIPTDVGNRSDCDTPSDGISIISDCSDVVHHHRHRPLQIDVSAQLNNLNDIQGDFDTPPNTPGSELSAPIFKLPTGLAVRDSSEKFSIESRTSRSFDVVSPANIILFSLLAGITGIVLGNAFRVRPDDDSSILNHISPLVLRIQDLERENSDLKSQLKKLKSSAEGSGGATASQGVEMIFPQPLEFYLEQNINENGKRVWTGDQDGEEPITLENTKMKMPEFCSEDKSDDLFSERFRKIRDEKVRKLAKTIQESQPQKQEQKLTSEQNNNNNNNNNCEASSTCSGCQSCQSSSTAKQSDVEANFADDDESSVDRVKVEREKSPHIKRKIKRQKPVKDDDSDSSSETTVINNEQDKANTGCKKGVICTGIFDKRKSGKKYPSQEGKENQKTKKANDDWNEKRKTGRDEMRRSNGGAASSGTDDWYTKRASNREKQRGGGLDKKK